jgi:hypothetical protein
MKTKLALIMTLAGCFLCGNIFAAPLPGAIFTTDPTCSGVDLNIYASKGDVYLNGGPAHPGAASLPDGSYYVRVTNPGGSLLLGTSVGSGDPTPFVVSGGVANCIQLCSVLISGGNPDPACGYDDTDNPGGEYKVWVSTVSTFDNNSTKTDNFKVRSGGGGDNTATLCVNKFYDANVNGINDDPIQINGWKYRVFADDNLIIEAETYHCSVVDPDTFHVIEGTPVESKWLHTTPTEVQITLAANDNRTVDFGNVCLGAGGGLTLGFWSNRNGQALETAYDFTILNALCLKNPGGQDQNFNGTLAQQKTALHDWLLNANASNMANMLSAQLAAMVLNVLHTKVDGSKLVYGGDCAKAYQQSGQLPGSNGFITVNDLMTTANTELCAHGVTLSGSPFRAFQECMKTTLDNANNNQNFVQGTPCPYSFPVAP